MRNLLEKIYCFLFGEKAIASNEEVVNEDAKPTKEKLSKIINNKKYNQLIITFKNGTSLKWYIEWKGTEENIIEPWQDFYDWFVNEKESEMFFKKYDLGINLIQRCEILTFNIDVSK